MIVTLLRMLAFLISTLGYTYGLEKKFNYSTKLSWIVVFCFNILVLYGFSFFLNMEDIALVMFSVGVLIFTYYLFKEGKYFILRLLTPDLVKVFLGLYFLLFAWTLLNSTLVHYDNFSHWALIVKFFVNEGRLPMAQDTIIGFSSYPIGSSLFVYYFTSILGYSEGVMLLGQFIFVMACFYAMFAFVKVNHRLLLVVVVFFMITLLNYFNIAIRLNNLLVDFLMPVLALATISGLWLYRLDIKRMSFHLVMTLAVLLLIKNSAFFFAMIALVYYLYLVFKYHRKKSSFLWVLGSIILIVIPYIAWRYHVDLSFVGVESKHDLSLSAYLQNFDAKSTMVIYELADIFLRASVSLDSLAFQGILLVNALFIILAVLSHFYSDKKFKIFRYLFGINLMFVIYYVGIFLMFVFSMPLDEARELAGFERYASSIVIMALGIFAMIAVQQINHMFYVDEEHMNYRAFKSLFRKQVYQYASFFLVFVSFCLLLSENNGMLYNMKQSETSLPEQVRAITGDVSTYNDTKYLLVASDETGDITSFYLQYIGRYYLFSDHVESYSKFEMENSEFIEILKKYDYVILVNKNYTFIEKIRQTTGMTLDQSVYEVKDILENLN